MKNNKSIEEQIRLNSILSWIMAAVVVLFAIIMVVDMINQKSIDPMNSSMIVCFGCITACLDSSNKKLKEKLASETK